MLFNVILIYTQVKVFCHPNHSLVDFCNLFVLCKSFEVMDETIECHFLGAIHTFLGDDAPRQSKALDAIIDFATLPDLH